eukprot:gene8937-8086_t
MRGGSCLPPAYCQHRPCASSLDGVLLGLHPLPPAPFHLHALPSVSDVKARNAEVYTATVRPVVKEVGPCPALPCPALPPWGIALPWSPT